jgi:hypothetical protein
MCVCDCYSGLFKHAQKTHELKCEIYRNWFNNFLTVRVGYVSNYHKRVIESNYESEAFYKKRSPLPKMYSVHAALVSLCLFW